MEYEYIKTLIYGHKQVTIQNIKYFLAYLNFLIGTLQSSHNIIKLELF